MCWRGMLSVLILWCSFCMTPSQLMFLYMAEKKLAWNINEMNIYDKGTKKKVKLHLYCNKLKILFKKYMNSVDVADQLRSS